MKLLVISINDEKILCSKIFFTIFSKMTLIEAIVIKVSKFSKTENIEKTLSSLWVFQDCTCFYELAAMWAAATLYSPQMHDEHFDFAKC